MKPSNRKQKGKRFEEQVASRIHQYCYLHNQDYKSSIEQIRKTSTVPEHIVRQQYVVRRTQTSGTTSFELGDIYLPDTVLSKIVEQYRILPVFECKKWKTLTLRKPFQLCKQLWSIAESEMPVVVNKFKIVPPNLDSVLLLITFSGHYDKTVWTSPFSIDLKQKQIRIFRLSSLDKTRRQEEISIAYGNKKVYLYTLDYTLRVLF